MRYLFFITNYLLTIQNACWGLFWFNSEKNEDTAVVCKWNVDLFFFENYNCSISSIFPITDYVSLR